jgi:hypothetical protein
MTFTRMFGLDKSIDSGREFMSLPLNRLAFLADRHLSKFLLVFKSTSASGTADAGTDRDQAADLPPGTYPLALRPVQAGLTRVVSRPDGPLLGVALPGRLRGPKALRRAPDGRPVKIGPGQKPAVQGLIAGPDILAEPGKIAKLGPNRSLDVS